MPVPAKNVWMSDESMAALRTLARRWGLSDSATIAKALRMALEGESE